MNAMVLEKLQNVHREDSPLRLRDVPIPRPGEGEVRLRVLACGVCHTELDEIEGRAAPPSLPVIPGHEVVGVVDETGPGAATLEQGDRVGVGWFYDSCGSCRFCRRGLPNLCDSFRATGRDANGGYAEYMVVPESSAYTVPPALGDAEAAPLLCAGGVGYRSLSHARIAVFTRSASKEGFARKLGADWAGPPDAAPPWELDAVIDTTPVWRPIEASLPRLAPAGRLVISAIRKTDADKEALLDIDYATHLWMEREIKSVANVAPDDICALADVKDSTSRGAAVLVMG